MEFKMYLLLHIFLIYVQEGADRLYRKPFANQYKPNVNKYKYH